MTNITNQSILPIVALDKISRLVLGSDVLGCSVSDTSIIHLEDTASASTENQAGKIMDNWGNLNPSPSASSMVVGDADPTITQTSADSDLEFVVTLDGNLYSSGTVTVTAGTATLTLVDPEDGEYIIYFARSSANFASGSTTITVTES